MEKLSLSRNFSIRLEILYVWKDILELFARNVIFTERYGKPAMLTLISLCAVLVPPEVAVVY